MDWNWSGAVEDEHRLIGYAQLLRLAQSGADLQPLIARLMERAKRGERAADALMDLSWIFLLAQQPEMAVTTQSLALKLQQTYKLPAPNRRVGLRLVALLSAGDYLASTPLDFLLEGSDVALELCFVGAELPLPATLPEHDVLFVAVCESDDHLELLQHIDERVGADHGRVVNSPSHISNLARDRASAFLRSAPGVAMPLTVRVSRATLESVAAGAATITSAVEVPFPIIVRPVGSHMGKRLAKIDDAPSLAAYLSAESEEEYYAAAYFDYQSADGQYRKHRVVLIDGQPFACHLAISDHWVVSYMSARMEESASKRAEEAQWMASFHETFAARHAEAFRAVHQRLRLDYVVLDCSETADGRLLIFEVDTAALVHATDPVDVYPYKVPAMQSAFTAFRALLERARREIR